MMVDHGARDHDPWSASATARNVACPGALALQGAAPADVESTHAARGTAAHQIAEKCLRGAHDAHLHLDSVEFTRTQKVKVDEEIVTSSQTYIDYVRGRIAEHGEGATLWLEERFSLMEIDPPFTAGGTGDAVIHLPRWRMLEVVDLKNGMGVVEVGGNMQLRTYGLGAMLAHRGLDVKTVRTTIVQPRAHHADGRIRFEEIHVADLVEWTVDLLAAMRRSKEAIDNFPGVASGFALDAWGEMWLRPGHCTFCRAAGFCPALKTLALRTAAIWFDPQDKPVLSNQPDIMSVEDLSRTLDMLDMLEDWIAAVRGRAHGLAEAGTAIPNYQLVAKRPRRAWATEDDTAVAAALAAVFMRPPKDFFEERLRSPAQVEKLLGARHKKALEPFCMKESSGTNLVRVDRTERPPVKTQAEKYYQAVEEN